MKNPTLSAAALILGGLPVASRAEAPVSCPIGTKVVTKYATPLRAGSRVVNSDGELRVYTVERVDGDWRWLLAESVAGWAQSDQVVPLDQAVDFYTHEIQANPGAALAAYLRRGAVRTLKGATDAALADYNEALRLDPRSAATFFYREQARIDREQYEQAITDLERLPPQTGAAGDILIRVQMPAWDDGALAGLPPGSHPEVLTWERAYTLALVRCRTPRPAGERERAESLDPKGLAEQARRLGIADFARFRNDLCAGPDAPRNDSVR